MLGREQQHGSRQESNKRKRHLFHRKFRQHCRLDIGRLRLGNGLRHFGLRNQLRHFRLRRGFGKQRFGTPRWHAELLVRYVVFKGIPLGMPFFGLTGVATLGRPGR